MKNLSIINECFPVDYRDIIRGYIAQIETIISNYDVVVFMARKAICFYHALKSVDAFDNTETAVIFSSRALTYNELSKFKELHFKDIKVIKMSTYYSVFIQVKVDEKLTIKKYLLIERKIKAHLKSKNRLFRFIDIEPV